MGEQPNKTKLEIKDLSRDVGNLADCIVGLYDALRAELSDARARISALEDALAELKTK